MTSLEKLARILRTDGALQKKVESCANADAFAVLMKEHDIVLGDDRDAVFAKAKEMLDSDIIPDDQMDAAGGGLLRDPDDIPGRPKKD